jgi:hypothetical protein
MSVRKTPIADDAALDVRTLAFCDSVHTFAKRLSLIATQLKRSPKAAGTQAKGLSALVDTLVRSPEFHEHASRLRTEWDRVVSIAFLQLDSSLRELCAGRGWKLDGQWPDFTVEFGISIYIDEAQHSIIVGDAQRIQPGELEEALANATADLLPKNFSPRAFMEKVVAAYDSVAKGEQLQIPILSLYREMVTQNQNAKFWKDASQSTFNPFTISQFRARVSRMLEGGVFNAMDGRELRLLPPLNPKDAIFVFQPSERRFGFVGRVEFVK